tara:strand:+ start:1556 stop:2395 length:840 start_codon:yes stop_codon:yes gene_type:complete
MKPERIIINSAETEKFSHGETFASQIVNTVINQETNGMTNLTETYGYNKTGKLVHSLSKFLERPTRMRVSKVSLPASMPTFNSGNNTLKMFKKHNSDPNQHAFFDIVMDTEKVYTTYVEFNNDFSAKLSAVNSNFSSTINSQTGILTIISTDVNFRPIVIERNLKFGFLFPMMETFGTSFPSSKSVELTQTPIIYVKTNIETNIYNSNQSTKILTFFGYSQTINDVSSGTFTYENKNENFIGIQTTDIQNLEIELLDINMNLIDLNSMPVSIELDLKYD